LRKKTTHQSHVLQVVLWRIKQQNSYDVFESPEISEEREGDNVLLFLLLVLMIHR
jgi:hypothetical protein